jgi:hypothetical protein
MRSKSSSARAIVQVLKSSGFALLSGRTFCRQSESIMQLATIYRSRFAPETLLDVGIVLERAPGAGDPTKDLWHLTKRASHLFKDRFKLYRALMSDETDISDEERVRLLSDMFSDIEAGFFALFDAEDKVLHYAVAPSDRTIWMRYELRVYSAQRLGVVIEPPRMHSRPGEVIILRVPADLKAEQNRKS